MLANIQYIFTSYALLVNILSGVWVISVKFPSLRHDRIFKYVEHYCRNLLGLALSMVLSAPTPSMNEKISYLVKTPFF